MCSVNLFAKGQENLAMYNTRGVSQRWALPQAKHLQQLDMPGISNINMLQLMGKICQWTQRHANCPTGHHV
jgi:hypothetical protein